MEVPLEISFQDVEKTEYLEQLIHEKVAKLEQICDHMISCRIAVEMPQKHQRVGNPYRVRIAMRVPPGHELVAKQEPSKGDMHADLPRVLRQAFDLASRQLRELVERQRGEVKRHPDQQASAVVVRLFKQDGYGFIRTTDGREFYFHRNSVLHDDFERLEIGTGVHFVEEMGEKGPQATSVQIVDKPGVRKAKTGDEQIELPLGWQE